MSFHQVRELSSKERKEILNLTEFYAEKKKTERGLLEDLRNTLGKILPQFLSSDLLELIDDFRIGKTPLLLFEGELFDKSMPLGHTQKNVESKILMPQEVWAMMISTWIGYAFTLFDEGRPEVIQRGAKIANDFGASIEGIKLRGFHIDNPQVIDHLADFLVFLLNNYGGINTRFSAVSVELLDKYKVGNYSLLELLSQLEFGTIATLRRLGNSDRIHPILANSELEYPEIILNERTIYKPSNQLINVEIPDKWGELALKNYRQLLEDSQINIKYDFALVNQRNQTVLHAVNQIEDYLTKQICADPNNPDYLYFRELIRVYVSKMPKDYIPGTNSVP